MRLQRLIIRYDTGNTYVTVADDDRAGRETSCWNTGRLAIFLGTMPKEGISDVRVGPKGRT